MVNGTSESAVTPYAMATSPLAMGRSQQFCAQSRVKNHAASSPGRPASYACVTKASPGVTSAERTVANEAQPAPTHSGSNPAAMSIRFIEAPCLHRDRYPSALSKFRTDSFTALRRRHEDQRTADGRGHFRDGR